MHLLPVKLFCSYKLFRFISTFIKHNSSVKSKILFFYKPFEIGNQSLSLFEAWFFSCSYRNKKVPIKKIWKWDALERRSSLDDRGTLDRLAVSSTSSSYHSCLESLSSVDSQHLPSIPKQSSDRHRSVSTTTSDDSE